MWVCVRVCLRVYVSMLNGVLLNLRVFVFLAMPCRLAWRECRTVSGHNRVRDGAIVDREGNERVQDSPCLTNLARGALSSLERELCSKGDGSREIRGNRD